MSNSKRTIIRNLSELAVLKPAATEPSQEGNEGGFVVGAVIQSETVETVTAEVESKRVVARVPMDGDSFYDPITDRYGRVTLLKGEQEFTNRIDDNVYDRWHLVRDEEKDAWILATPDWAMSMVSNYRSQMEIPEAIGDRQLFDIIEQTRGMMPEDVEETIRNLVGDALSMEQPDTSAEDTVASIVDEDEDALLQEQTLRNAIMFNDGDVIAKLAPLMDALTIKRIIFDYNNSESVFDPSDESNRFAVSGWNRFLQQVVGREGVEVDLGKILTSQIIDEVYVPETDESDASSDDEIDVEEIEAEEVEVGDFEIVDEEEDEDEDEEDTSTTEEEPEQAANLDFEMWSAEVLAEAGRPPKELNTIPEDPAAAPTLTIVSGNEVATVSDGEITHVSADGEATITEVPVVTRQDLIDEINRFMVEGKLATQTPLDAMTDRDLKHHLDFLKMNNGGSADAAAILREIEADYERLVNDPAVKRRLALLAQRGSDFALLAQKMSRIMGNDVTIKGLRYQEYHELLAHLTKSVSVVFGELTRAADYMGIKMPIDELVPSMGAVPIIEGMPIDEKTAMYIMRCLIKSLENWHHTALTLQDRIQKALIATSEAQARYDMVKKRLDEEIANRDVLVSNVRKKFIEHDEFFIYVDSGNGYIAMIDEEARLSVSNLEVTSDIREAIFLNSKTVAERVIEVLEDHPRFSAYSYSVRRLASIVV